jgi:hypothetical protein
VLLLELASLSLGSLNGSFGSAMSIVTDKALRFVCSMDRMFANKYQSPLLKDDH